MSSVLAGANKSLAEALIRGKRWLILAMMLSLHAALVAQPGGDFERIWLMVHFGLFLLWQPFISTEYELNVVSTTILLGITAVAMFTLAGWMLVMWIAILIGIMGGKVFTSQAAKRGRFYLVAVFYLFAILLTWTVPISLLDLKSLPSGLRVAVSVFLPAVLILLTFLPFRAEDEASTQVFDFFYSLFVFQLVVVLVLGSIAAMRVTGNQYFQAVVLTVLAFAGALFTLAILWAPRAGYGGLRTYFSRYLMSVGMPFELWMRRIAELSETEMSSARFLEHAMNEVATTPWINGSQWTSPDGDGRFGVESVHSAHFRYHELEVTFFTEIRLSPALFLHLRLLAQVVGEFYEGKRREQVMKQNAYMQAVHETGARLTHDIKNLLQSLFALTSMSISHQANNKPDLERRNKTSYDQLLERQLPQLTKRLQTTLEKLKNPAIETVGVSMRAADWWQDVIGRHAGSGAAFKARGDLATILPATLFDTALENCLENARKKKEREPEIHIAIELTCDPEPSLTIADTGSAITTGAAESLFRAPVANTRRSGLGIGLFQASKQAEQGGYVLTLAKNEPGEVIFALIKRPA